MRFGLSFPLPFGFRGFFSAPLRRGPGILFWLVLLVVVLTALGASARPCATCATITDKTTQDVARSRSTPSNTNAGASCATIADPQAAAYCRARQ